MDWTGPNASVAAGNALLDQPFGEDIVDLTKHVYQLGQTLRSKDGTDTGLTGFDLEFAVRLNLLQISEPYIRFGLSNLPKLTYIVSLNQISVH